LADPRPFLSNPIRQASANTRRVLPIKLRKRVCLRPGGGSRSAASPSDQCTVSLLDGAGVGRCLLDESRGSGVPEVLRARQRAG
jgi:hypothetical protein